MRIKRLTAWAVAAVVITALATGCGGADADAGGGSKKIAGEILAMPEINDADGLTIAGEKVADADLLKAARQDTLVWYTGSGSESAEPMAARFEAETGIDVKMTRMPSADLNERVLSEAGAGRLSAGVVTVTDPILAEDLAKNGVFVKHEVPNLASLKGMKNVVWQDGVYYSAYYSAYALAYNDKAVTGGDVPTAWKDLLDERFKGKLGVVNAGAGGTVQGLAAFQTEVLGADYLTGLAAQKPRIYDTTSVQLEALARGEVEVVTAGFNSTYGAELAGAPVKLVIPDQGVSGTFNMQGLTTTGADSPAAKVFMNWTMSKAGQEYAMATGFVGARTDLEQIKSGPYQLPSAADPSFVLYTPDEAHQQGRSIVATWNKTFGYSG